MHKYIYMLGGSRFILYTIYASELNFDNMLGELFALTLKACTSEFFLFQASLYFQLHSYRRPPRDFKNCFAYSYNHVFHVVLPRVKRLISLPWNSLRL